MLSCDLRVFGDSRGFGNNIPIVFIDVVTTVIASSAPTGDAIEFASCGIALSVQFGGLVVQRRGGVVALTRLVIHFILRSCFGEG